MALLVRGGAGGVRAAAADRAPRRPVGVPLAADDHDVEREVRERQALVSGLRSEIELLWLTGELRLANLNEDLRTLFELTKLDTLFQIASTSKAFTSTALAMLASDKKLSFDDPVRRHLPYFRLSDMCADQAVTLRDIMPCCTPAISLVSSRLTRRLMRQLR